MENLYYYNALRQVPPEAKKEIQAGRLKGKTDINPMWRIKALTDIFGPCGVGWKYEIAEKRMENGANGEIAAFVDILLYIFVDGKWSDAIPGTGGSAFVSSERNGLYTSDECFKMALTDAISVSCKALGVGADVYWEKGKTKYDKKQEAPDAPKSDASKKKATPTTPATTKKTHSPRQAQVLKAASEAGIDQKTVKQILDENFGGAKVDGLIDDEYAALLEIIDDQKENNQ
jgi:hypothetical protein